MVRTTKSVLNRLKAVELQKLWGIEAKEGRLRETGDWYNAFSRFPAALLDAHGYILFATEEEYRTSPHISIGKQISVKDPGISAIPSYIHIISGLETSPNLDVDIHTTVST